MTITKLALHLQLVAVAALWLSPLAAQANMQTPPASQHLSPSQPQSQSQSHFQPRLTKDINSGTAGQYFSPLITVGAYAYYLSGEYWYSASLWRSDGTAEGTSELPNTRWPVAIYGGGAQLIGAIGNRLLFNLIPPDAQNSSIWIADGLSTTLVKPQLTASAVFHFNNADFVLDGGKSGLWRFDAASNTLSLAVALGGATSNHVALGNWLYYLSAPVSFFNGTRQLWRTDGTAANTQFIKSIPFHPQSSNSTLAQRMAEPAIGPIPPDLPLIVKEIVIDNMIYFRCDTDLWRSDGTTNGTLLVSNALGEENRYFQLPLIKAGKRFYFVGQTPNEGTELWMSDGSASGTKMVRDIQPGPNDSLVSTSFSATAIKASNNLLYFVANDGGTGAELWQSDGTVTGTQLVKDIAPIGDSAIKNLVEFNNTLFFTADDRIHGRQLWTSDGTAAGTQSVTSLGVIGGISPNIAIMTILGSQLIFSANTEPYGNELWTTDGTVAGTHLILDSVANGANSTPTFLANSLNKTFFTVSEYQHGLAIWASDSTGNGGTNQTEFIRDVDEGAIYYGDYGFLGESNGMAYFHSRRNIGTPGDVVDIWRTDGSITGTAVLTTLAYADAGNIYLSAKQNEKIYYNNSGRLWRIDPSANSDIQLITSTLNFGMPLWQTKDALWFVIARSETALNELWQISAANDQLQFVSILDSYSTSGISNIYLSWIKSLNNGTLFLKPDPAGIPTLWRTDGTPGGTISVTTFTDSSNSAVRPFAVAATPNALFITAQELNNRNSLLWRTDGTITGTKLLTTTAYFTTSEREFTSVLSFMGVLTNANRIIYNLSSYTDTLYYLDPNTDLLQPLTGNDPNNMLKFVEPLTARTINGLIYFIANQRELWRTDGTPAGTKRIFANNDQQSWYAMALYGNVGNELIFSTYDSLANSTIWSTHGDKVTMLVQTPKLCSSNTPTKLTIISNTLYFCGNTQANGDELWVLPLDTKRGVSLDLPAVTPIALFSNTLRFNVAWFDFSIANNQNSTTTLTATLPLSTTYISDTLSSNLSGTPGISPTLNGNTIVWQIPNPGFGQHDFTLQLQIPNLTLGTRYPITFTLSTLLTDTNPADNNTTTELWLTTQTFLPTSQR